MDPNGSPVAGAQVILYSSSSNAEQRRTEADKQGRYSFTGLAIGAYKLSASAPGFQQSPSKIVFLTTTSATATLTLTALEARQTSQTESPTQKSAPAFSPSGVRGATAPSGYSSGLSSEETAHVRAAVDALEPGLFATVDAIPSDCSQESGLLHNVEKAPHQFAPNHTLGAFYLAHGDYSKAAQYLDAARALAPTDFTNTQDLALAMVAGGRSSDAVALLEQLLSNHESNSTLLRLLAFAYRSSGENDKSIAAFQKAAANDMSAENQYDCGIGLIQLGALKQALDVLAEATKLHPESARLWFALGTAEHLLDHKQEAVSALLRSSDADIDFLPPLVVLAELSSLSDETKVDLRRRIAAYLVGHPGDAGAHFAYAVLLSKQLPPAPDDVSRQEIATQLKRALALNPRMPEAHFMLGEIEAEANNLPSAIAEFNTGLKMDPKDARAHYRLSLLYRREGQLEAANKEMESFSALRGKPGEEGTGDTTGAFLFALPATQPQPLQRPCGAQPK